MGSEQDVGGKDGYRIRITKGGPYVVTGGVPLLALVTVNDEQGVPCAWKEEKRYPTATTYALCRCGRSSKKPFCDGTHSRVGFIGKESRKKLEPKDTQRYEGPQLVLSDTRPYCSRARFCHRGKGVWQLTISPTSRHDTELALEIAANCPAGRLVELDCSTGRAIEPELEPSIAVISDPGRQEEGPLWVRGGIHLEGADGKLYERRNRMTLCRCGLSENMPFCDGSHAV